MGSIPITRSTSNRADARGTLPTMNIILNGQATQVVSGMSLVELLALEHLEKRRVAVEVNREIIPRSQHAKHHLNANDEVEIIHAIGGG